MLNFTFQNPTKILFGKGQISALKNEIPKDKRILLIYGGGSIKQNGVYDQVVKALDGVTFFEFSGIEPNPRYETLMKAVEIIRREKIDFLLAVGGGSVIDGTKFIAAAANYTEGDPWEIVTKALPIKKALPFASILTLPATGSEMNSGSVVSRDDAKLAFIDPALFPVFSILDPETTYTLPPRQVTNGIIDTYVHVIEQYVTYPVNSPLQDRFAEGILLTLIEEGPKVLKAPKDYDVRANLMWCSTLALNGLLCAGVPEDWSVHVIGHEITALFGLDHAQALAIVLPAAWKVLAKEKEAKLLQYGERVLGITEGGVEERIQKTIERTREFFESLGAKTHLRDYNISKEAIASLVQGLKKHGMIKLGEKETVTLAVSEAILKEAF